MAVDDPKLAPVTDLAVYASLREAERAIAEPEAPAPRMLRVLLGDEHPWTLRYETDGENHEITDGAAMLLAARLVELVKTRAQLRRACRCSECLAGLTR